MQEWQDQRLKCSFIVLGTEWAEAVQAFVKSPSPAMTLCPMICWLPSLPRIPMAWLFLYYSRETATMMVIHASKEDALGSQPLYTGKHTETPPHFTKAPMGDERTANPSRLVQVRVEPLGWFTVWINSCSNTSGRGGRFTFKIPLGHTLLLWDQLHFLLARKNKHVQERLYVIAHKPVL